MKEYHELEKNNINSTSFQRSHCLIFAKVPVYQGQETQFLQKNCNLVSKFFRNMISYWIEFFSPHFIRITLSRSF